jgi:hypothetical protein
MDAVSRGFGKECIRQIPKPIRLFIIHNCTIMIMFVVVIIVIIIMFLLLSFQD